MALDRHTLARDGTLVEERAALGNHAVHRNGLATAHHDKVAHLDQLDWHLDGLTAPDNGCHLGTQVHERRDCLAGLALGACFKELAEGDKRQNHARRLEIQVVHEAVRRLRCRCGADTHEGIDAVDERRTRTDRNQRVHGRGAMQQGLEAVDIVFAVDDNDGKRQHKLGQREREHAVHAGSVARQRQTDHLAH